MKIRLSIALFFFTFLIPFSIFSQVVKFENVYGGNGYDYGYSVCQTFDKGYVVVGATTSFGSGNTDAYLLKVDSLGAAKWQKIFGGINIDQAYSVKETKDSGLIIVGYTNSFGKGGYDMYVIKTDKMGNTNWAKTYGGSNWDFAYSVESTLDGGYIIAGGTYSFGNGNEDVYLVKVDSLGNSMWEKTYGGLNDDESKTIKQTIDGGFILTGFSKSFGNSNGAIYTIKTNSVGDTLWTNKFGDTLENIGYTILESNTGDFILGGKTNNTGTHYYKGVSLQFSPFGSLVSSSISNIGVDEILSIAQTTSGRIAKLGNTTSFGLGGSDYILHVYNSSNILQAGSTYGGTKEETAYCINNTQDGGYIICGTSSSYTNFDHIYLIKSDSNGVSSGNVKTVITGLNSISKSNEKFNIYPNPANDKIYINLISDFKIIHSSLKVNIYDLLGREYFHQDISNITPSNTFEISTNNLKNGVYIIAMSGLYISENIKLIVKH